MASVAGVTTIALGCDHGGFGLKSTVISVLEEGGYRILDMGCHCEASVDYPEFADQVCAAIREGRAERGILICGTGIGMSIAANRYPGIRAALCHETVTAHLSREHNDANVLCLGARILGVVMAREIVRVWLTAEFAGGRHLRRINLMG
ncbi:MAG: ribose 5-phosphate isomerase B [Desulfobulbus sp.]|jgi:ribose 5-phosphate isomerase B